ncbi:HalOD1 output domain-containing protein [Haladaptatus sp. DFWS20]|uniref:HalOD1 output domain-containing protein n=1 Tax=Haladaptatus sp. DFWS20 TaxID=3403467 RepID=UPI003EBD55F4
MCQISPETTTPEDREQEQFCYRRQPNESPSEAVLTAVSAVSNRKVIPSASDDDGNDALEPLYDTIDPDALDSLFDPIGNEPNGGGSVTFTYSGHEVTVKKTREILVRAPSDSDDRRR